MQSRTAAFIRQNELDCTAETRYIDLISELGELGKELLKGSDYGRRERIPTAGLQEELGDCLFSLLALCEALHIDAEDARRGALNKYAQRIAEHGRAGSR